MSCEQPILLLSCEHASGVLPRHWRGRMAGVGPHLRTHRSFDIRALAVFRGLVRYLNPALAVRGRCSRLLVDLNRSLGHPRLFSPYARQLTPAERERVLGVYYHPFRGPFISCLDAAIAHSHRRAVQALHISVHSFTPVLDGMKRKCDIAFLYAPSRPKEKRWVNAWIAALMEVNPRLRIRRNHPYRGVSDGHTTELRKRYGSRYCGIEIEINQDYLRRNSARRVAKLLAATLGLRRCTQNPLLQKR